MFLLPQLPMPYAEPLALEYCGLSVTECLRHRNLNHANLIFSPIGGSRISDADLKKLIDGISDLAISLGYPNGSPDIRFKFDVELAIFLETKIKISDNEASKPGIWNFLSCVALPDLVRWRFQGSEATPVNRFISGQKNMFERLWWRARAYYDETNEKDPYWLVREIREDESVGIMERTALSGIRPIVPIILKELIVAAKSSKILPRSEIMRDAMKRFLRLSSIIALESQGANAMRGISQSVFQETLAAALQKKSEVQQASTIARGIGVKTVGSSILVSADKITNLVNVIKHNQMLKAKR